MGTRNWKLFLKIEREKIKLILPKIPGIKNSRRALKWTLWGGGDQETYVGESDVWGASSAPGTFGVLVAPGESCKESK